MTFNHPHMHNFHSGHTQCRTNIVGLIYMPLSAMKSGHMLVASDIRKQKSYRLNLP